MRQHRFLAGRFVVALGVAMLAATCGGCAFGDRQVALQYRQVAPTDDTSSGSGRAVTLAKFDDLRKGKDIGEVRNGYWMKTAAVKAQDEDLGGWVANALAMELEHRRFAVEKVTVPPPNAPVAISGTLSECWTKLRFLGQAECTVRLTVRVDKRGMTVLNKEYAGVSPVPLGLATADEWGDGTENALRAALKTAMPEIVEACK